jgi:hypothetical protein
MMESLVWMVLAIPIVCSLACVIYLTYLVNDTKRRK